MVFILFFISMVNCDSCFFCLDDIQSNESRNLLEEFCSKNEAFNLDGRCCFKNGTILIGVDLSNCKLQNLDMYRSNLLDIQNIQWLAVNQNPNLTLNNYRGFIELSLLVIDKPQNCDKQFCNQSLVKNGSATYVCAAPINPCVNKECPNSLTESKVNKQDCPENSNCHPDGPGLFECNCAKGWHDYRCLRKQGFPLTQWMVGFSVATILICIVLRILQRKGLKNGKELLQQRRFLDS
ncbi:all-trans retinoic acid-induced differentiation factor isoform X3 [Hydra vulgaris]|uniref:All-trans retinoic acid-induced differentiation factor isoform X3 n=1 Tax=Hydra vulgaris TaxID=6087 RepID=A0ABM4D975_HYDVU